MPNTIVDDLLVDHDHLDRYDDDLPDTHKALATQLRVHRDGSATLTLSHAYIDTTTRRRRRTVLVPPELYELWDYDLRVNVGHTDSLLELLITDGHIVHDMQWIDDENMEGT